MSSSALLKAVAGQRSADSLSSLVILQSPLFFDPCSPSALAPLLLLNHLRASLTTPTLHLHPQHAVFSDPLNWDNSEAQPLIQRLAALSPASSCALFIDSFADFQTSCSSFEQACITLTLLAATQQFHPIVFLVNPDQLTPLQHRNLEDISTTLISIPHFIPPASGWCDIVKRSLTGKVTREREAIAVSRQTSSSKYELTLPSLEISLPTPVSDAPAPAAHDLAHAHAHQHKEHAPAPGGRQPKMSLALDEGATNDPPPEAPEQTKGPRIFMQDDDCEFDDLDSDEDPDDDLDI